MAALSWGTPVTLGLCAKRLEIHIKNIYIAPLHVCGCFLSPPVVGIEVSGQAWQQVISLVGKSYSYIFSTIYLHLFFLIFFGLYACLHGSCPVRELHTSSLQVVLLSAGLPLQLSEDHMHSFCFVSFCFFRDRF